MPWSTFLQIILLAAGVGYAVLYIHRRAEGARSSADELMGQLNNRMMKHLESHATRSESLMDRTMALYEQRITELQAVQPSPPAHDDVMIPRNGHRRRTPEPAPEVIDHDAALDVAQFEADLDATDRLARAHQDAQDDGRELVNPEDV